MGQPANRERIPGMAGCGTLPAPYQENQGLFLHKQIVRAVRLITHLHPGPNLNMFAVYPTFTLP